MMMDVYTHHYGRKMDSMEYFETPSALFTTESQNPAIFNSGVQISQKGYINNIEYLSTR